MEHYKHDYYEEIFKAAKNNDREEFRKLFFRLHVIDQLELFQELYPENKRKTEAFLTPAEFAKLFEQMKPQEQQTLHAIFSATYIAQLLPHMELDNVVKFLAYLAKTEVEQLLTMLDEDERLNIKEMLIHEPETAGSIMNKSYIVASAEETVQQTAEHVRTLALSVEMVYYVYIVDEKGLLIGVVSLRDLILQPKEKQLADIMLTRVVSVDVASDQEEAALLLQEYDLLSVPVTSQGGQMLGIITVDDVMDVLAEENLEDFHEFAAISKSKKGVASEETIWGLTRVRMPWIILLIFLGMISASLINTFEDTLNEVVLLAAFIPIIMDSAGNVGTQSLAVAVRNLTINESSNRSIWKVIWQESMVGTLLGIAAGVTLSLVTAFLYGNTVLALIIGFSLWMTLTASTVVGAIVPIFINKLNIDPAVASGPFITTINDTVGLFIYFSIASQLLHLL